MICEGPNNRLDKFQGNLHWNNAKLAVDNNNIVLRVNNNINDLVYMMYFN